MFYKMFTKKVYISNVIILKNEKICSKMIFCLKKVKTRKKSMPPHLIIMDKVVLLGVIFLKMKCVCKTQMMPPPDHKKL